MKRLLLAVLFGTLVYTIALASAATIGTVTDSGMGAGNTVVASCDTDGVNTAYTTAYSSSTPGYNVTAVSVTSINTACNGKAISVTVAKSDGSTPATGTGSVASGAANNIAVTPAIPASNAGQVYVVIG
jgi:hypothetical protein